MSDRMRLDCVRYDASACRVQIPRGKAGGTNDGNNSEKVVLSADAEQSKANDENGATATEQDNISTDNQKQ